MFCVSKKLKWAFRITLAITIALTFCFAAIFGINDAPDYQVIILLVVFMVVGFIEIFAFYLAASLKYDKLSKIMIESCDPVLYVNTCYPLSQGKLGRAERSVVLTNLALGYVLAGDSKNARMALLELNPDTFKNPNAKLSYYNTLFEIEMSEKSFEAAQEALNKLKLEIDKIKKDSAYKKRFVDCYNINYAHLSFEQGKTDGVEEVLNEAFLISCNATKAFIEYLLGRLYLQQGRNDEAFIAFGYAAKHGGTTYSAQYSKQYLAQLNHNTQA